MKEASNNPVHRDFSREKKPSNLRRANFHNYALPGIYMITITTRDRQKLFGTLITEPEPFISYSHLGYRIHNEELLKISKIYPNVELWKSCIMPDHIHLILHVHSPFPEGRTLWNVISGFESGCRKAWREITGAERGSIFEKGYHDRILLGGMQVEKWKKYLDDNPRRLALKQSNPDLFIVTRNFPIGGIWCMITGNQFLLDIPDKMEVIVHSYDNDATYAQKCNEWMACGERGGVLVSAAISKKEKAVIWEALRREYNIIFLRDNGFPTPYKPAGIVFDACAHGHVLQISPWTYSPEKRQLFRPHCLYLNQMATMIASGNHASALLPAPPER